MWLFTDAGCVNLYVLTDWSMSGCFQSVLYMGDEGQDWGIDSSAGQNIAELHANESQEQSITVR